MSFTLGFFLINSNSSGRDCDKSVISAKHSVYPIVRNFEWLCHKKNWENKLTGLGIKEVERDVIITSIIGNGNRGNYGGLLAATKENYMQNKTITLPIWKKLLKGGKSGSYEKWIFYWNTYQEKDFINNQLVDNYFIMGTSIIHPLVPFPFVDNN